MFLRRKVKHGPDSRIDKYGYSDRMENGIRIILKKTDERTFYDTKWDVTVIKNDAHIHSSIIRLYEETAENLDGIIRNSRAYESVEMLNALDEHNKIYYD